MVRRLGGLVLSAWALWAGPLQAEPARRARSPAVEASGQARALELFERSVEEYRAGRFRQAADLLREAYALHAEPTLLYNLARALEGLGDDAAAVEQYEAYLRAAPTATDRGAIEQRVATLRRQIEEREALTRAAFQEPPDPERDRAAPRRVPRRSSQRGPWPWLVSGVGLAALGAGGALGVVASSRNAAADDAREQTVAWSRHESARDFATAANACFVGGGVILAAGIVWILLSGPRPTDEADQEDTLVLPPRTLALTF